MSKPVKTRPTQFFKVVLPATLEAKKLKIPNAFVEYFNGFPDAVVIQNKMGKLWPVSLGHIRNEFFFQRGWENFVKDNSVECGDFLVFNYDGDHKFDVMIFGRSACEKIESGGSVGMVKEVKMEEDDIVGVDVSDDQSHSVSNVEDSDDSEYNAGEEEEEEVLEDTEEEEEEAATTNLTTRGKKKCGNSGGSKKRAAKKDGVREKANDVLAGVDVRNYVQKKNPFFVVKMSKRRGNTVCVPSYVMRDFRLELADEITFKDKLKREWPGTLKHWKDGRAHINGWRTVCRWNHVGKDGCYICEFPETAGKKQDVILVHAIHGAGSRSQTRA